MVGAGAIGGTVGAHLVRAGHDVLFVDNDRAHVDALRKDGLHIEGPVAAFRVPVHAATPDEVPGTFDTVLLCVKAHATETAAQGVRPFLAQHGCVVSLQNGLNERVLERVVGRERTVGCFVNFGADYLGPGVIHFGGRGALVLGELDGGTTPRLSSIHQALLAFEPNAITSPNIWGFLWSKLAVGAMIFATALTDASIADCYADARYRTLFVALAREVLAVAAAQAISPEPFDGFEPAAFADGAPRERTERSLDAMVAFNRRSAKTHSGVWRDLAVRKRKTEAEAQLGAIVQEAGRAHLGVPLVEALLGQVIEIEYGRRRHSESNLDTLAALLPSEAGA